MAQKSKKDLIVETALPLFLENGFKGSSIDMVVRACAVSKPTVYNHFPDKAALMLAVVNRWSDLNKPQIMPISNLQALDEFIRTRWLTDEAIKFYAIVIGEGWRFPEARQLFWSQFDRLWRKAFGYVSDHSANFDPQAIELHLDHRLMQRLRDR